jgi:hypothetical protein
LTKIINSKGRKYLPEPELIYDQPIFGVVEMEKMVQAKEMEMEMEMEKEMG